MPRLFYLPLVEPGVYVKPKGTNKRAIAELSRNRPVLYILYSDAVIRFTWSASSSVGQRESPVWHGGCAWR